MNDLYLEDKFFRLHPNGSDSELAEFKKIIQGVKFKKFNLHFLVNLAQKDLNVDILPHACSTEFEGLKFAQVF
jgi:hypothetical protein